MKNMFKIFYVLTMLISLSACSTIASKWKSLVTGEDEKIAPMSAEGKPAVPPSFNNEPNFGAAKDRQYKRVTKQNFSEAQGMEENAGSLWKKEGQGSFLFAQNNLRILGDIINVDVDGKVAENLNIKVDLIKKAQVKMDFAMSQRPSAPQVANRTPRPGEKPERVPAAQVISAPVADQNASGKEALGPDGKPVGKEGFKFDAVPCRIVDKNVDGSYRVKGQQTVFIGKKEYKLIVTGNIRADDISMDMVASSKVIDSKFDLVPTNKEM